MSLHRFDDEWLVPAALKLPGVSQETIVGLREQCKPLLAQALIDADLATASAIGDTVVKTLNTEYLELSNDSIDKAAVALVPERICRRQQLIPFSVKGEQIHVAMANPFDIQAKEDIQASSGRRPVAYYCSPRRIGILINEFFSPELIINDLLKRTEAETGNLVEIMEDAAPDKNKERDIGASQSVRAPVTRLVNAVISKAVQMRASDIHIEHEEHFSIIRYRIDGILKNMMTLPRSIGTGIFVSRIKVMADMDIANHRTPQDSRARIRVGAVEMGLRVSVLPAQFGETVVIRILDPRSAQLKLEALGLHSAVVSKIEWILGAAQGMLLVTGPTGSGKTTTIYSVLNELKMTGNNIVTVEDPVEYRLEGLNQVQVKEKHGLGFASALRSILRQDPDVIMVGEIRDRKTADISFQAALTGHFVVSTLHANNTFSAIARLVDMGVERFKIAPALLAVTAQRLVRRLCTACREPVPPAEAAGGIMEALSKAKMEPRYFRPRGCARCARTGYSDRIPLFEYLDINQALKDRLSAGDDESALRRTAEETGALRPLLSDVLWRLSVGDTSLEELLPHMSIGPASSPPKPAPKQQAQRDPPIYDDAHQEAVAAISQEPLDAPPRQVPRAPRRILIADDDPVAIIVLSDILERGGDRVITAKDGIEAMEMINQDPPEMLIVDLGMPQLDGYGVIRGVRHILGLVSLPVIVISSHASEKSQERAFLLGADDYITKPYKPALVMARINALFRRTAFSTKAL